MVVIVVVVVVVVIEKWYVSKIAAWDTIVVVPIIVVTLERMHSLLVSVRVNIDRTIVKMYTDLPY